MKTLAICALAAMAPIAAAAQSIDLSQPVFTADEAITLTYSGMPEVEGTNWIAVADPGAPPTERSYREFEYLSAAGGTLSFSPLLPGRYEIRVYYNWPDDGYRVRSRVPFEVILPEDGVIATDKAEYQPNEPIVVSFSDMPGNRRDWIAISRANAPSDRRSYEDFRWLESRRDGELRFDGLGPGRYDVRAYWNFDRGGYEALMLAQPFVVLGRRHAANPGELAEILIEETSFDTPPSPPYSAPAGEVVAVTGGLTQDFSLSEDAWRRLLDAFFYADGGVDHHRWRDFAAFVDDAAISQGQQAAMIRNRQVMTAEFGVPEAVWHQIAGSYHSGGPDYLYRAGIDERYRDNFDLFMLDRLENDSAVRGQLNEDTLARLQVFEPPEPTSVFPQMRARERGDVDLDCSPAAVRAWLARNNSVYRYGVQRIAQRTMGGTITTAGGAYEVRSIGDALDLMVEQAVAYCQQTGTYPG